MRHRLAASLAVVLTSASAAAQDPPAQDAPARPQLNLALLGGVAGVGTKEQGAWETSRLFAAFHADVLLGRNSTRSWGIGPMARVGTYGFSDAQAQLGASLLVPVHDYLPFVLTAGGYTRLTEGREPGAFASLFWGTRSFNYHGSYVMAGGLVVEARATFGDQAERTVIIAGHADLQAIALPVVMLINAFRLHARPSRRDARA